MEGTFTNNKLDTIFSLLIQTGELHESHGNPVTWPQQRKSVITIFCLITISTAQGKYTALIPIEQLLIPPQC